MREFSKRKKRRLSKDDRRFIKKDDGIRNDALYMKTKDFTRQISAKQAKSARTHLLQGSESVNFNQKSKKEEQG